MKQKIRFPAISTGPRPGLLTLLGVVFGTASDWFSQLSNRLPKIFDTDQPAFPFRIEALSKIRATSISDESEFKSLSKSGQNRRAR